VPGEKKLDIVFVAEFFFVFVLHGVGYVCTYCKLDVGDARLIL